MVIITILAFSQLWLAGNISDFSIELILENVSVAVEAPEHLELEVRMTEMERRLDEQQNGRAG